MFRGKAGLRQHSAQRLEPVVEVVVEAAAAVWNVDVDDSTFGPTALRNLEGYYQANAEAMDAHRVATLDFDRGKPTSRAHTAVKVIDLVFFTTGGGAGAGNMATKRV